MAALDLITLADYKVYRPVTQGAARDAAWSGLITAASRMIENELGRRLRYRAPATTESAVLASTAWGVSSPAVSAQPNSAGRTLIVTFTTATGGTLTVVGTVGGVSKTVVFDAANGLVQHGLDFFTAIASFTIGGTPTGAGNVAVTTSQGYIEFHTLGGTERLLPLEWPIANILEVNEDISRTYGTSTRLAVGTDYLLSTGGLSEDGVITRVNGVYRRAWFGGWRAVKLVHAAGYSIATVPEEIKDVCRRLVSLTAQEVESKQIEVASGSNALGSWSRFGPATLTKAMREQLSPYRRSRFNSDTGDRDFDLEAA